MRSRMKREQGCSVKPWCEDGIFLMRARNKTRLEPWLTLSHTQMCVQCTQCGGDWQDDKNVRATGYAVFTPPSKCPHSLTTISVLPIVVHAMGDLPIECLANERLATDFASMTRKKKRSSDF